MFMSAYVVEDKTINRVITWLKAEAEDSPSIRILLAGEGEIDLESEGWDGKLARAMFQLNCDAVNIRYGEHEAEKFRPLNFIYKPEYCRSQVQVLKSLQCWQYQCNEGDISERPLYQFFEEVEKQLALKIVMD